MSEKNEILDEVNSTLTERGNVYGDAAESFAQIADIWTSLLRPRLAPNRRLTPSDVGLLMAALKIVREANMHKRDNLIDAVGYLTIVSRINE